MHRKANCNAFTVKLISFCFSILPKLGSTRMLNEIAFNCTHKTGRTSSFKLIADTLFTVIITTKAFVSHVCSSFYSITVRASVNERYVVH